MVKIVLFPKEVQKRFGYPCFMLDVNHINLLAVLLATILGIMVGFVWYHPKVFGRFWADHQETPAEELTPSAWIYLVNFVAVLVMSYVLAQFIFFTEANGPLEGAVIGFWTWLGFSATTALVDYIFAKRSPLIYIINYAYQLLILVLMGAVIGFFR